MKNNKTYKIYLFVNSRSGSGQGKQYLTLKNKNIEYKLPNSIIAIVSLFDLLNAQQRNTGMAQIAKLSHNLDENTLIRVVICGGDGTIMWVIGLALEHQVNFENIVFGILPIGTGNDFSRCLGWGHQTSKFSENNIEPLNNLIHQWIHAGLSTYDLWDIQIQTFHNGAIHDIKSKIQHRRQDKVFKKSFTNYVGLGIDARVVYTCQRKRSSIACLTKIIYGCVGFCNFFRRINKINETMENLSQSDTEQDNQNLTQAFKRANQQRQTKSSLSKRFLPSFHESEPSDDYQNNKELLNQNARQLQSKVTGIKNIWKEICVNEKYTGLVCLNSPSYMAGLRQVWNTNSIGYKKTKGEMTKKFKPQLFNDGLIEFVGFRNQLSLALQRIMRCGGRVTQGPGPFQIKMKKPKQNQIIQSYLQIDGESIKVSNLKSISIFKTTKIPGSQINIMIKS